MLSRAIVLPVLLTALALPALAGCDLGTVDPVSLSLTFQPDHALNEDGTCTVQYTAIASGFGDAEWERVTVRRAGTAVQEYVGSETAQFWGASSISAGQVQESAPYIAPDGGADTVIEVQYDITGSRTTPLNVVCPQA